MASLASTNTTFRSDGSALPPASTTTECPRQVSNLPPSQPPTSDNQVNGQSADDFTQFQGESMSDPSAGHSNKRTGTLNSALRRPLRAAGQAWSRMRSAVSDWPHKKRLYTAARTLNDLIEAEGKVDRLDYHFDWTKRDLERCEAAVVKAYRKADTALSALEEDGTMSDEDLANKMSQLAGGTGLPQGVAEDWMNWRKEQRW